MTIAPKVGDRIELVSMPSDPDPIPPGTRGTVTWVNPVGAAPAWGEAFTQYSVDWDNGRRLGLVVPPDEVRNLETLKCYVCDESNPPERVIEKQYPNRDRQDPSVVSELECGHKII